MYSIFLGFGPNKNKYTHFILFIFCLGPLTLLQYPVVYFGYSKLIYLGFSILKISFTQDPHLFLN